MTTSEPSPCSGSTTDPTSIEPAERVTDQRWLDYLHADLPDDASARAEVIDDRLRAARWPRYRDGWIRYLDAADPAANATIVIDNNDLARPAVVGDHPTGHLAAEHS